MFPSEQVNVSEWVPLGPVGTACSQTHIRGAGPGGGSTGRILARRWSLLLPHLPALLAGSGYHPV